MYQADLRNFCCVVIGILFFALIFCLAPLQFGLWALAQDVSGEEIPLSVGPTTVRPPGMTRVVITTSEPVMYEHYQRTDPPQIVIQFLSRNVVSRMEESVEVNRGVVKEIQCRYYPRVRRRRVSEEGRPLKSLVIVLTQPTIYQIVEGEKAIIIAIENPPELLAEEFELGEMEIAEVPPKEESEVLEEEVVREEKRDEAFIKALSQAQGKLTGEEVPPEELGEVRTPVRVEEKVVPPVSAVEEAPERIKEKPIEGVKEIAQPIARPRKWYDTMTFYIGGLLFIFALGGLLLWLKARRTSIQRKKLELEKEQVGELAEVEELSQVSPAVFERLFIEVFEKRGYKVLSSEKVEDKGLVSIIAKEGERALLQYKREEGFVDHFSVRDFYQSMAKVKADRGYLATTGSFTHPAKKEAEGKPIDLIDRGELLRLVSAYLKEAEEYGRIAQEVSRRQALEKELAEKEEMMKGESAKKEKVIEEEKAAKEKLLSELKKNQAQLRGLHVQVNELGKKEEVREKLELLGYPLCERRRYPRLRIVLAKDKVGLVVESEGEPPSKISSRLKDISAGGLLLELEKGEEVMVPRRLRLKLKLPEQPSPIEISGQRVWQKKNLSGVSFSSLADDDKVKINRFIKSRLIRMKEKRESQIWKEGRQIPTREQKKKREDETLSKEDKERTFYPLRGRSIWTLMRK